MVTLPRDRRRKLYRLTYYLPGVGMTRVPDLSFRKMPSPLPIATVPRQATRRNPSSWPLVSQRLETR